MIPHAQDALAASDPIAPEISYTLGLNERHDFIVFLSCRIPLVK